MKPEDIIKELGNIKKYLCAGNPIYDVNKVAEIMDAAIDAVEKEIPMPLLSPEFDIGGKIVYPCGNCGNELDGFGDYCKFCGQKIKHW